MATMLPLSMTTSPEGELTQDVQVGQALPMTRRRYMELLRQRAALEDQQPDVSAMQEYAKSRAAGGESAMMNALAAQFAGERFSPFQAQFLKRAAEAQQPMKLGRGMLTSSGQFLDDPFARQNQQVDRLGREIGGLERLMSQEEQNAARIQAQREAAQTRADAAREAAQLRADVAREAAQLRAETAKLIASMRGGNQPSAPTSEAAPLATATPPKAQIITPDINPSTAMGLGGKVRSSWNKIGDLLNAGDPEEANRQATEQLSALANATRTTLQESVPGRMSNYLVQLFDKQAIRPNELFTGAPTAQARIQAVKGMLQQGIEAQTVAANNSKPDSVQRKNAEVSVQRLRQLMAEYDALAGAFAKPAAQTSGAYDDPEKERRYQEYVKRMQGAR